MKIFFFYIFTISICSASVLSVSRGGDYINIDRFKHNGNSPHIVKVIPQKSKGHSISDRSSFETDQLVPNTHIAHGIHENYDTNNHYHSYGLNSGHHNSGDSSYNQLNSVLQLLLKYGVIGHTVDDKTPSKQLTDTYGWQGSAIASRSNNKLDNHLNEGYVIQHGTLHVTRVDDNSIKG